VWPYWSCNQDTYRLAAVGRSLLVKSGFIHCKTSMTTYRDPGGNKKVRMYTIVFGMHTIFFGAHRSVGRAGGLSNSTPPVCYLLGWFPALAEQEIHHGRTENPATKRRGQHNKGLLANVEAKVCKQVSRPPKQTWPTQQNSSTKWSEKLNQIPHWITPGGKIAFGA